MIIHLFVNLVRHAMHAWHSVALKVHLSRGRLKLVLPYQRLGGEAPLTFVRSIATSVMPTKHFTSVKVIKRELDELKLSSS